MIEDAVLADNLSVEDFLSDTHSAGEIAALAGQGFRRERLSSRSPTVSELARFYECEPGPESCSQFSRECAFEISPPPGVASTEALKED